MTGDEASRSFGSGEVAVAAGIPLPTLDSWLLRRLFTLPPGPGSGRARRYTLLEALRVACTAELTRLGVAISISAPATHVITEVPDNGPPRLALLLTRTLLPLGPGSPRMPAVHTVQFTTLADIADWLGGLVQTAQAGFVMVDVTEIAQRVKARLADPAATLNEAISFANPPTTDWKGWDGDFVTAPAPKRRGRKKAG